MVRVGGHALAQGHRRLRFLEGLGGGEFAAINLTQVHQRMPG
jgi:hypothetical protein